MRISDVSSDVCSSDLILGREPRGKARDQLAPHHLERPVAVRLEQDQQPTGKGVERIERGGDLVGIVPEIVDHGDAFRRADPFRSEEHTSELQSLMRISYAVFCLKKKTNKNIRKMIRIQINKDETQKNK